MGEGVGSMWGWMWPTINEGWEGNFCDILDDQELREGLLEWRFLDGGGRECTRALRVFVIYIEVSKRSPVLGWMGSFLKSPPGLLSMEVHNNFKF